MQRPFEFIVKRQALAYIQKRADLNFAVTTAQRDIVLNGATFGVQMHRNPIPLMVKTRGFVNNLKLAIDKALIITILMLG